MQIRKINNDTFSFSVKFVSTIISHITFIHRVFLHHHYRRHSRIVEGSDNQDGL